jgi:hypothetical protein
LSERGHSKKQVLVIIAVTWILSFVTTLVIVNHQKSWHMLEIYDGTFNGTAEVPDFLYFEPTINSDIWRISWHVSCSENPPQEDVLFYFVVAPDTVHQEYPRNYVTKEDFRSDRGGWYKDYENGIEYFFGSGKKYLTIQGIKLDWTVIIEEYY